MLVSRDWSGKTLADHRADARAWVKALLGITTNDTEHGGEDQEPAPVAWELARPDDPDVPPLEHRLLRAISARIQQRQQLRAARERLSAAVGNRDHRPDGPPPNVSTDHRREERGDQE